MDQDAASELIDRAKAGDQQAFAELYNRYFDPVYDFLGRLLRDREEAANAAQDTFLKAMNTLGGMQEGASFKSWLFTIARNTALDRIERGSQTRPLTFLDDGGVQATFDVVDGDRFGNPADAAEARAVASLVWEAAAGLDPKQLSLLDLHLRQGLDSAEIAEVLGVTKNNGDVMLNRLKKTVEDAIGAFIMLAGGRQYCEGLDSALSNASMEGVSPDARRLVARHVAQCDQCEERRRKLVAPLAVFGAFTAIGSPVGAKTEILEELARSWPGPASIDGNGGNAGPGSSGAPGRALLKLVASLGVAVSLLLAAVVVPAGPLSITKDGGRQRILAAEPVDSSIAVTATEPVATSTASGGGSPPTATSSPTGGTPAGEGTPGATPASAALREDPTPTNTPPGTITVSPATATPTGTATKPATVTATPTRTPAATATPIPTLPPCTPSLFTNTDTVNASTGSGTVDLHNSSCGGASFQVSTGASWIASVTPATGTLAANAFLTLSISANAASLREGQYSGLVQISWSGGSLYVTVLVSHPGSPPTISAVTANCTSSSSSDAFSATVEDDYGVASVVVSYVRPDSTTGSLTMTFDGSKYSASGSGPMASWSIAATDFNAPSPQVRTVSGQCAP